MGVELLREGTFPLSDSFGEGEREGFDRGRWENQRDIRSLKE